MKPWNFDLKPVLLALLCGLPATSGMAAGDSLAELIRDGEREAALALIEAGADVNAGGGHGETPLLWAVHALDENLVDLLLRREADPNQRNHYGASPLGEAVKAGHEGLVRRLLQAGADPEAVNGDGQTALMLAARVGKPAIARLLLEQGADPNATEEWRGQSALMWAAASGHVPMVELLIEHGADVELRARSYDWGSQITSEPRAQYRPAGGLTPLLYAARSGCLDCVRVLAEAGADIDRPTPEGVTPLMIAIDNFRFDTAAWLLENGANPHVWDWWGRTALYIATDMNSFRGRGAAPDPTQRHDALDLMRQLLEAGVNPDPQLLMHRPGRGGNSGRFTDDMLTTGATPLLRAADTHDLEAVRLLLAYGAKVDLPNIMGVSPMMAAAGFGAERGVLIRGFYPPGTEAEALPVVELLLESGADIHRRIEDTTSHNARIARLSSMTDRQGQTALFAAAKQGWVEMMKLLLAHGADLHAVDDQGKTVLDAAMGQAGGRVELPVEPTVEFINGLLDQD